MKKEIPYAILAVVIMVIAYIVGSNSALFNYKEVMQRLPLEYMDKERLIIEADAIVLGKATEHPEDDGEVYTLEVNDILYGILPETVILALDRSTSQALDLGNEYVFFLIEDAIVKDTYHLISISQGIFEIRGDTFENHWVNMKFDRKELVDQVKALK